MMILKSIALFILSGLCEIGGGYLIWLWLKEAKPLWFGILGAFIVVLYGIKPLFKPQALEEPMPLTEEFLLYFRYYGPGSSIILPRISLILSEQLLH
jgi:hypothetical protein